MTGKFENSLFNDLVRDHAADEAMLTTASRRRIGRPLAVGAAAVAIGGIATAAVVVGGGQSSPAYAVTKHGDGTVTVSFRDVHAVDPANAQLKKLGLPVRAAPVQRGCTAHSKSPSTPRHHYLRAIVGMSGKSVTVDPRLVPPHTTLVIGVPQLNPPKGQGLKFLATDVIGAAPACLPD
ncbi:hypothetical protein AB0I55_03580 [Actinocatenispora sera]|uniref:hypothetical protein n=1 Tax=Actinocatenispora sera TaxID=390989 RepID=UPI0033C478D2